MLASVWCFLVASDLFCAPLAAEAFGHSLHLKDSRVSSELYIGGQPHVFLMSERASSNMIGRIMALLATFDEAGILPPEGTAQANQIIHGLIQLQSTLMKSTSAELAVYQQAAKKSWEQQHPNAQDGVLEEEGLTHRVFEALIEHEQEHPMWNNPKIASAMHAFNVSQEDWMFIVKLFNKANGVFCDQGRSIHAVYDAWRLKFPGSKS